MAIAVARAVGATSVFAIEVNEHRAKIARAMKADYVLNPAKENVRAIVAEKTGGLGVDVVLEMAGHPDSIRTAFDIVRRGEPTAGIQHGHTGLELQTLDDDGCPIGFREGIVQLHQPPQPYRTGDRAAAGTNAPDDGDETDEADQAKKNVCDRCHGLALYRTFVCV